MTCSCKNCLGELRYLIHRIDYNSFSNAIVSCQAYTSSGTSQKAHDRFNCFKNRLSEFLGCLCWIGDCVYPDIKPRVICYQPPTRIYHEDVWDLGHSWSSLPVGPQTGPLKNNALRSLFADSSCTNKVIYLCSKMVSFN